MSSVRVPPKLEENLRLLARRQGVSVSDVYRKALNEYVQRELPEAKDEPLSSPWDEIIGVIEGPGDGGERISEYFAEGMLKKHGRHYR